MEYRFIEPILSELHRVTPDDAKAFRARLRILRDVGVPAVERPGKGARIDYTAKDVFMMHLGLIFDDASFPPIAISEIVKTIESLGIYKKFLAALSESAPDEWLRVQLLRNKTCGESRSVLVDPGTIEHHLEYMKAQEGQGSWAFPAMFYGLINMSHAFYDCQREIEK